MLPAREDGLAGQNLPRLDVPAKIDGSATFAADIRLPNMVFASLRQGPVGDATLKSINEAEAKKVTGFQKSIRQGRLEGVAGTNWRAVNRALELEDPAVTVPGPHIVRWGQHR